MKTIRYTLLALLFIAPTLLFAHGGTKNVKLHVDPRWKECSFMLDASLTQQAWREFTQEAGLAVYFRPLTDARPIGTGNYEFSVLQWQTSLDDTKSAWNDTFVHPDSVHWLKDGDRLPIPGLTFKTGITDKIDVGAYWVKNPEGNYGMWGGQVQYALVDEMVAQWAASTRVGFVSLYGPDDVDLTVYGIDLIASKKFVISEGRFTCSPYAGISGYVASSHEKSPVVQLKDETVGGAQGMLGVSADVYFAKLGVEYNFAEVSTLSFKIGVGF